MNRIFLGAVFLVGAIFSHRFMDPYESPKEFYLLFMVLGMVFFAAAGGLRKLKTIRVSITAIDLLGFLFILYILFRAFLAGSFHKLDSSLILILVYCSVYVFLRRQHTNQEKVTLLGVPLVILYALFIVATVIVCLGLFQYYSVGGADERIFRITGSSGNPGPLGLFLASLLPLFLGVGFYPYREQKLLRYLSFAIICLIAFILVLTRSRASWLVGFFIGTTFIIYWFRGSNRISIFLKKAVFRWSLLMLTTSIIAFAGYKVYHLKSDSADGRLFIWQTTISMIADAPVFGHGYKTFQRYQKDYQADYFLRHPSDQKNAMLADNSPYAFNEPLQMVAELGLMGFLLGIALCAASFRRNACLNLSDEAHYRIFVGRVGLAGILIGALFFYSLHSLPIVCMLVLYVSMIANLSRPVYEIQFSRQVNFAGSIFALGFVAFLFNLQGQRLVGELDWKLAYSELKSTKQIVVLEEYKRLYPVMKHSPQFLFNYGTELSVHNQYPDSFHILKEASAMISHSDLFLYQGINLEALDSTVSAKRHFEKASLIVPQRIYPKYRLFVLLHNRGDYEMAEILAQQILEMEVKIETQVSRIVKLEMKKYLEKQSTLNG